MSLTVLPSKAEKRSASQKKRTAQLAVASTLTILISSMLGCKYFPESTFKLATDSRLPKWITIPRGLTRANVDLSMSYYIRPWGRSALFTLKSENKQTLEKVEGKMLCNEPLQLTKGSVSGYPAYEAITVNGMTETIEHRKMEPVFSVTDDALVRNAYLAIGCGQPNGRNP